MSLVDRVALITGSSRGIGYEIALEFGQAGAVVLGTATTDIGAEKITNMFAELGIKGRGYCLDVSSDESVKTVIKDINQNFGTPDILVNNAGITRDGLLMRMSIDEWNDVVNTNLTSVYRMTKACLRGMTKNRFGRIISIGSVIASMGNAGQCNYAATKAGLEGFSRSLAKEIGGRGITVNVVVPGFVETDMTRKIPEEQQERMLSQIPLQRLGQPKDISSLVLFLASDRAGYITGETIHVNGGLYSG